MFFCFDSRSDERSDILRLESKSHRIMSKTKIFHVCLSSHDEVMFRNVADLNMGFNCLATASLSTESRLFADGFMSTHYHYLVQTSSLKELMYRCRYSYARYFNEKYHRSGRLGEKFYYNIEISGLYHTIAALNYVIRQGLHHGLATTPFGYPHCSANAYFKADLGKKMPVSLLPDSLRYKYLPSNVRIPTDIRMSEGGLLLREDVLDVAWVEQNYITPRNFLFQMNRIADEKDLENQQKENGVPPVTMETIETGVPDFVLKESKVFEYGKVNRSNMTDLELCSVIDTKVIPRFFKEGLESSIYQIPYNKKAELFEQLLQASNEARWTKGAVGIFGNKYVTNIQLKRCLGL